MNKKNKYLIGLVCGDLISAALAWIMFYSFRKTSVESVKFGQVIPVEYNQSFYLGLIFIPLFWLLLYTINGSYKRIFYKSRLRESAQTFLSSLVGVLILFFTLLLDDEIYGYKAYYQLFVSLFLFHFCFTFFFRILIVTRIVKQVHSRGISFTTLLIGSNANALRLFNEIESQTKSSGNKFIGFIHIENKNGHTHLIRQHLPHLGELGDVRKVVEEKSVEEIIIAIESSEHEFIKRIISELEDLPVIIKIIPDMYDILVGSVKMTSIFGAPLIEISHHIMPTWQVITKRLFDVIISAIVLTIFSPVYLLTALMVKMSSKGPVIYSHERIGLHGKPFKIHKFRSMYVDAEKNGPMLSSKTDNRITPFGKFMRRTRLDEIPQFYNVMIGEMSIVGPRPERSFYIEQIIKQAPHYRHLQKVRPGITSWGQVKYGYAENVDQMVERLRYDILYIENMSLSVDFKILIYTVLIVLQGRGK